MAGRELEHARIYFHVSSSIGNWKEKIRKRYGFKEYKWWRDSVEPVVFFGMYTPFDYARLLLHRGPKTVVWCGSDILQLGWFARIVRNLKIKHICENKVEQEILEAMGIQASIRYNFYEDPLDFRTSYFPSRAPHVFLHCHGGKNPAFAKTQCGLDTIERISRKMAEVTFHVYGRDGVNSDNVKYHGQVSNEQFNREIRGYHAGLRLHSFDGFSEIIAKSVLLGQYPISRIDYPHIDSYRTEDDLILLLRELKEKKEPNPYREWWRKELSKPL